MICDKCAWNSTGETYEFCDGMRAGNATECSRFIELEVKNDAEHPAEEECWHCHRNKDFGEKCWNCCNWPLNEDGSARKIDL